MGEGGPAECVERSGLYFMTWVGAPDMLILILIVAALAFALKEELC